MGIITTVHGIMTYVATALIILFAGFIIAKLAGKIIKRVLAEAELNNILIKAGFKPISEAIGTIVEYVIYAATLLYILHHFGLTKIVLTILASLAGIMIIGSLVLAIRDFLPNFIAGLMLRKTLKKNLGKKVQIGTVTGRLTHYGPVASIIKEKDQHYIAHAYAIRQKIKPLQAG